jgi:cullin 3
MNNIVENCFANDNKFQTKVHQSFDDILNKDRTSAYYLALYSDEQMRNGFRSCTDKAVELSVDRMVAVLRHISDKDVFESYYKNQLSRRLLGQKSVSEDIEKLMISKLKAEYGYQFTSKLERMFTDIAVSRADLTEYKKGPPKPLDCEFTILTAGYWPSQSHDDSACLDKMPVIVMESINDFFQYYSDTHSGRRLSWQFSLGSADIRMTLPGGKAYDFTVSTYQMMILALFAERDSATFEEICAHVPIPDLELKRHLLSLCTPAMKIINKTPAGKVLNPFYLHSAAYSLSCMIILGVDSLFQ